MKTCLSILLVTALTIVTSADVLACGDKFFVPGRGAHFVPSPSERGKASVLFYAPTNSALAVTLAQLKADAALRKAGYKPTVVTSPQDLASATSTSWDIVLVDTADGPLVKRQFPTLAKERWVGMLAQGTGAQLAVARKDYAAVIRPPSRNQDILDVLDDAASRAFDDMMKATKGR